MNSPDIRIRWNPADNDVTIAIALDGTWWGMSGHLAPLVEDDPTSWPVLQPAVTQTQAREAIAAVYDTLESDLWADRRDEIQDRYVLFMTDVLLAAGIKVEPSTHPNSEDK